MARGRTKRRGGAALISSMTGFARVQGGDGRCAWTWEVRSVNGKGRDVRCRLPVGFAGLEAAARERVGLRFRRGSISLTLSLAWTRTEGAFRVNLEALESIAALVPEVRARVPDAGAPRVDGLLALAGVLEAADDGPSEEARGALEDGLLGGLDEALDAVAAMRGEEGARLADVARGHLGEIARLEAAAGGLAAMQPEAIRRRLAAQVAELVEAVPAIPAERLAQEAALLMTKADVREELDRLQAHLEAARQTLAAGGAVGRKLDFLCQELNREANTLCSKSADVELTGVGLELKAAIEQLREQVQNIE